MSGEPLWHCCDCHVGWAKLGDVKYSMCWVCGKKGKNGVVAAYCTRCKETWAMYEFI